MAQYLLQFSAGLLLLITIVVLWLRQKWSFWASKGVVTPPILDTMLRRFRQPMHEVDLYLLKKYGPIVGSYEGARPTLIIGDAELAKNITVRDFGAWPNHRFFSSGGNLIEQNLFNLNGSEEAWKRIRSIMSPTFTSGKMRGMVGAIEDCVDTLMSNLESCADSKDPVDMKRYFGAFTMDVICSTAFGVKTDSIKDPDNPMVDAARRGFNQSPSLIQIIGFMFPKVRDLFDIDLFDRSSIFFFADVVREIIKNRKLAKPGMTSKHTDFIQLMLEAQDDVHETDANDNDDEAPKSARKMSEEELIAQGVLFFFAGYDTTASTLAFAAYLLASNRNAQKQAHKDVDSFPWDSELLNYDTVHKFKYVDATIWETLRLFPAANRIERVSVSDYTLGDTGIVVPPNTIVSFPAYAIHRDPKYFDDPESFCPERFLSAVDKPSFGQSTYAAAAKHPYAFMPFGSGPRICIGMRLALLEAQMCLASVLRKFQFKYVDEPDFYAGAPLLSPKHIRVIVERR